VLILLSHHGRGQHGCGDQPSRQNFKSSHSSFLHWIQKSKHFGFTFGNGWSDRQFKLNYLFMFVHRRARSAEETITNSGRRSSRAVASERAIGGYSRSEESFLTVCETRSVAETSIIGLFGEHLWMMNDLKRPLIALHVGVGGSAGPIDRKQTLRDCLSLFRVLVA
jgi:hypothetical protein